MLELFFGASLGPRHVAEALLEALLGQDDGAPYLENVPTPVSSILVWAADRDPQTSGSSFLREYLPALYSELSVPAFSRDLFSLLGRFSATRDVAHRALLADALSHPAAMKLFASREDFVDFLEGFWSEELAEDDRAKLESLWPESNENKRDAFFRSGGHRSFITGEESRLMPRFLWERPESDEEMEDESDENGDESEESE